MEIFEFEVYLLNPLSIYSIIRIELKMCGEFSERLITDVLRSIYSEQTRKLGAMGLSYLSYICVGQDCISS